MKIDEETTEQYIRTELRSGTYMVLLTDPNGEEKYHEKIVIIE